MPRAVDRATAQDRPPKNTMRKLWIEQVTKAAERYELHSVPIYLTLCGAHGVEVQMLVESGVLRLTETNSIEDSDAKKVVAAENSPMAALELVRRFPGLKIVEQSIESLIHSDNPTAWPAGEHEELCRAYVVNLDLNDSLVAKLDSGRLTFPVLIWISKIAQLHAQTPHLSWILCLTLHGEVTWPEPVSLLVHKFLQENFALEPAYARGAEEHLGPELYEAITIGTPIDWRSRGASDQQAVLMALVPKQISQLVHAQGWLVRTIRNLRYGGSNGRAPMVSWIIEFDWEPRASSTPGAVYRECLRHVFTGRGKIEEDGSIS